MSSAVLPCTAKVVGNMSLLREQKHDLCIDDLVAPETQQEITHLKWLLHLLALAADAAVLCWCLGLLPRLGLEPAFGNWQLSARAVPLAAAAP